MTINELINQLKDMVLLYGNKTILTISDCENEYDVKSITGKPCAKYFEPKDKVAEVTITVEPIGRKFYPAIFDMNRLQTEEDEDD